MKNTKQSIIQIALFAGLILSSACTDGQEEAAEADKHYDTFVQAADDAVFAQYRDSLETYFGTIEIELIKQYKINHENLKDEEDFYLFYRNANALRHGLNTSLNKFAEQKQKSGHPDVHEMPWFSEVAKGLEILTKNEGKSYSIQFDYLDLDEHAKQTVGNADDEFMKLLHLSFYDHSDTPKWLHIIDLAKQQFCSELGSGKHLSILLQADKVSEASDVFHKEVHKAKVRVISDALFNKRYCRPKHEVLDEMRQILDQVELKDAEKKMIKDRIGAIDKGDNTLQFDCLTAECAPVS